MTYGIYESLITESLATKLKQLPDQEFYINKTAIDKEEAVRVLAMHLQEVIARAFQNIKSNKDLLLERQIEISNRLIEYLHSEINQYDFKDDLIDSEGLILKAVFSKIDSHYSDLDLRLKEITPASRLTQSELFTGGNVGLSLDSELKKEIGSADRIDLLVSFIKWKAIVLLREAFKEFTERGGQLRIITTTYMGATDAKAIQELSALPNTQIKVSYNTGNERLHAKAYLFYRNTGFHTGYIGSSNFSRSALTDGLEWNVKVTTKEIPHIIDKFRKTFETYWQNPEFERYDDSKHFVELAAALNRNKLGKTDRDVLTFFDVKPYHYQSEILEKLQVERIVHGHYRNLLVAATGTGKTMISAFDFKNRLKLNPQSRLLFVAHRIEILKQARATFRNILRDQNYGELLGDGYEPTDNRQVFATIQTLANRIKEGKFSPDYYDYVALDEVHHAAADSYQQVIQYLRPEILLGLTATPERADGKSILRDFDQRIAAEIRLPDALNNKLLCPFQYFAISDAIDLDKVKWVRGKYDVEELTRIYTNSDQRVRDIIQNLNRYCKDINDVLALGFCISKDHAKYMALKFESTGLRAAVLTSDNAHERDTILAKFKSREFNYLFVVDMFNEGVDIPEVDTVLFLRPTESLTIFLQQLGRGLRLHDNKDSLTVLDFVGNANPNYDFESKFRALIGKTNTTVQKEIESDFVHLPLGCSIILEKKAKEIILNNIRKATSLNKRDLMKRLQNYVNQTELPLTLANFIKINNIPYQRIYLRDTWSGIRAEAGLLKDLDRTNEKYYKTMLSKKWVATNSLSYFRYILELADRGFIVEENDLSKLDTLYLTMLHYDFWQDATSNISLKESIETIGLNKDYVAEIKEYLQLRIDAIDFEESECLNLEYKQPLQLHARYTRDQILAAFGLSTLDKKSSNREGTAENKLINTELLFINLQKSEEDFSPTTMYDDYAIDETLFHWQSQSQTTDTSPVGMSYIKQSELNKKILLFVRESKNDMYGNTAGYVFVGLGNFVNYEGSKPMSITWKLEEPIPEYLWTASAKMSVG
ncbi:DUF3427 domain-containing protein [Sphingobacterium yanglingense]|uniref:Superfamily II DNA or RNA helicase n=1 Tax=Sphingobacterium yanglingense TaxID=1437280 RepID=A0A4R6WSR6_9SPHI|nr:DEAD/DEAH box helicase [Sphingobacterium yanglingense]TDQ79766.1 superfamily II DNA or RNA helicase [Sphingobacterium yanglingense]